MVVKESSRNPLKSIYGCLTGNTKPVHEKYQ